MGALKVEQCECCCQAEPPEFYFVQAETVQGKRIKSYLGGQVGCKEGANNEKQVQECWMQQALIGQSGRIKASHWSRRV